MNRAEAEEVVGAEAAFVIVVNMVNPVRTWPSVTGAAKPSWQIEPLSRARVRAVGTGVVGTGDDADSGSGARSNDVY